MYIFFLLLCLETQRAHELHCCKIQTIYFYIYLRCHIILDFIEYLLSLALQHLGTYVLNLCCLLSLGK